MNKKLPLSGIKVLEFTHAVMGPTTGLLLADMGAEVIHIEPTTGDATRFLKGFGTGYFPFYSRNKKSMAIDIKSIKGKEVIYKMIQDTDVLVENFGPGTMERLGYGYEKIKSINERTIYCSLKGFMAGPYEKRHAMDEVVQMMGGLAYMTGRSGDPLRAGTSVIDITGGMFGFIGILTALYERERTQKGGFVQAALFETTAFLMGQHMAYSAITKVPVPPMPERVSAWSIYRIFETKDNSSVFIGIISEKHWVKFCEAFECEDWKNDPRLDTNNKRIAERSWFIPLAEAKLRQYNEGEIIDRCDQAGIPFAPIARPEDLFEDIHLNESNGLLLTTLPDGTITKLPNIPLAYNDVEFDLVSDPPQLGEHTINILKELGYSEADIVKMKEEGLISVY
jgi:crotonobetainyl-CoA:carnitine CoA-transferase CaiB-like acyl-CoA transferase